MMLNLDNNDNLITTKSGARILSYDGSDVGGKKKALTMEGFLLDLCV
jgi:hypothetical protein